MPQTKYKSKPLGKTQYAVLKLLHALGAKGATTAELKKATKLSLRTIQISLSRLNDRGLVTKFNLKHNKNKWYYSEDAADYLIYWPSLPQHAKSN